MPNTIERKHLQKALDYESYRRLLDDLLIQGKTTGTDQSEQRVTDTIRNVAKMQSLDNNIQLEPEIQPIIQNVKERQYWIVLIEGWCKDAAQAVPVLHALATLNNNIEVKLLLRDDNLDLMDRYLTNGKSRSIPRLIGVEGRSLQELFTWGVSPELQKSEPAEKCMLTQKEITNLIKRLVQPERLLVTA